MSMTSPKQQTSAAYEVNVTNICCIWSKCNKYISVFAPGTLGILPDTYLVPVSHGLGDIISIYQYMNVKYQNNLQYMGLSNISIIYIRWDYGGLSM